MLTRKIERYEIRALHGVKATELALIKRRLKDIDARLESMGQRRKQRPAASRP